MECLPDITDTSSKWRPIFLECSGLIWQVLGLVVVLPFSCLCCGGSLSCLMIGWLCLVLYSINGSERRPLFCQAWNCGILSLSGFLFFLFAIFCSCLLSLFFCPCLSLNLHLHLHLYSSLSSPLFFYLKPFLVLLWKRSIISKTSPSLSFVLPL